MTAARPALPPPARSDFARSGLFYAFILLALCAQQLVQWVVPWEFKYFLLYDQGAALKADWLVAQGLRPGVDFAYSYGLMSIDIGRMWFAEMGRTPFGFVTLSLLCSALLALGIMHAALAMRLKASSLLLLIALTPFAIHAYYLNQTHALEAVVLIWAIGLQARGRLGAALALATLCLFIKPSLAYVYGLMLIVQIAVEIFRAEKSARLRLTAARLLPAVLTLAVLSAYCAARYGGASFVATILPLGARRSYEAAHFGFFAAGKDFWAPPRADVWRYLWSEVGFWLLSLIVTTLFLVAWPLATLARKRRSSSADWALLSAIGLHVAFVLFFYAWQGSWVYYSYLLMIGMAGVVDRLPLHKFARRAVVSVLAALALMGQNYQWQRAKSDQPDIGYPETAGLRSPPWLKDEWEGVHTRLRQFNGLMLTNGFADGIFGDVRMPRSWFMSPGLQTATEIADIRRQIAESKLVVRYRELNDQGLDPWNDPAYADLTKDFTAEEWPTFILMYRRNKPEP